MTSKYLFTLSFVLLGLTTISFSLPIENEFTSTSFPVNPVEGHFARSFTNEMELFSSTLFTPLVNEMTTTMKTMQKKSSVEEDRLEISTPTMEESKRDLVMPLIIQSENSSVPMQVFEKRASEVTTRSPITSEHKFVARDEDTEDEEHEETKPTKKPMKTKEIDDRESVESEENLTTSSALVAQFDPEVLGSVSTPAGNQLQFDENQQVIVRLTTGVEELLTTEQSKLVVEEEKPKDKVEIKLNQGSTLLLFILAAFLCCACLLASTLAFVKTRQSLKRKSRIIEMEAHLDDHYLHYHPLLFQQHFHK